MDSGKLCILCESPVATVEESCSKCPKLSARKVQSPGSSNAVMFLAKNSRLLAAHLTESLTREMWTFFTKHKDRALIIAPLIQDENLVFTLCAATESRREQFFRSHCFVLPEGANPFERAIVSTQGHVVQIELNEAGELASVLHMGQRIPINSHVQTVNGNHILRVRSMVYPYAANFITDVNYVWSPFLFAMNFSECSNMLSMLKSTGVWDELTEDCSNPFTIFLPRNDTLTNKRFKYLLENASAGEQRVFVKRHLVEGYLMVDTQEHSKDMEGKFHSVNQVETLSMDMLRVDATYTGDRTLPFISIQESGEEPVSAMCVELYPLLRGPMVIIDSPLYAFPENLSTRSTQ